MNRKPPSPRPKDDPHDAPASGDKPDAARPADEPKRRKVERQAPPAPPPRGKRGPEGDTAPDDNVSQAPEGGDRLEGGPLGR